MGNNNDNTNNDKNNNNNTNDIDNNMILIIIMYNSNNIIIIIPTLTCNSVILPKSFQALPLSVFHFLLTIAFGTVSLYVHPTKPQLRLFPFRRRSLPFLTVNATISNQAFSDGK